MSLKNVNPAGIMVFILWNKKFLLILRDDKPEIHFPNTWSPVTGGIEKDEDVFIAAERELLEEIGVIPKKMKILGVSAKGNGFFIASLDDQEKDAIILGEGQKYDFFHLHELSDIEIKGAFGVYLERHPEIFRKIVHENYVPNGTDFGLAIWSD